MSQKFIKNKENFTCEHCGREVVGTGYTNHCPECIWSRHVDVHPGDRKASCGGLMKPIFLEMEKGEYIVTHRCEICKYEKRNKLSGDDNVSGLIETLKQKN